MCTCCHHMLFHKTVQLFHTTDYDMSDETVKSHQYVMKLHRHTCYENDEIRINKWPQFGHYDVEHDNIHVMNEFICIQCRNSLRQKKQRCLTRHKQMVCSYMTSHRIYKIYFHWREELSLHKFHS